MNSAGKIFDDHIRLAVRLTPNGGRDAIDGFEADAEGACHIKVRVTAIPEKGKANKALIALLSKALCIPKSSIQLVSGDTSRKKILRIDGDPKELMERLEKLLKP
ncbi:DUF167 domain-containing protein [Rhizobium sullae]|uniref:UPF0235 protein CWR43_25755 n=1 Tax=Rhizobium sullae TaxID=50338 RepID=A0A2N0D3R5_RHISU|nr:DUF167 domain-containing protein [Rhizobium sullae]PKA40729.1 DUF167 domain-containing protein [Rhizobium sullae]TCU16550.1 hypothetical protein EV132_105307 [Rhizobium sullae]UWU13760.1 DUF167 domain-containing protein [Rhizobium sullae]